MSRNLLSLSVAASLLGGPALADVPQVAVDIAPVHSLVARVMADVGTPDLIVQSGASPHEYSLRPSEAQALQDADLVFWIGPDLTPWMGNAVETLAGGATVTTLSDLDETMTLPMRDGALFEAHDHGHNDDKHGGHEDHADEHGHEDHAEEHGHDEHGHEDHADEHGHEEHAEEHGHEDHADKHENEHGHAQETHEDHSQHEGHGHGAHDPHVWLSPANASAWMTVIAARLSAADPENAGAYYANAAEAQRELAALSADIDTMLEPVRGKNFIVFHDAYQYFEQGFDIPSSGAVSISDASDPSPARIAEIQARVAGQDISCVLSEPQFDPGIVSAVMQGSDARTGVIDPLGSEFAPGPALYPDMLRSMATALANCL